MTITIANVEIPISVEQEADGWFVARGRLSLRHCEEQAASIYRDKAVSLLRRKLTVWSK